MSKCLKNNLSLIHFLTDNTSDLQLKTLLKILTNDQVDTISELAANILYGNIPISNKFRNVLKKSKGKIEYIGNAKNSVVKRKSLITREYRLVKLLLQAAKPLLKTILQ